MSDSLQSHGLQHARLHCPSPFPRTCSNSCPSSQWYHPTTSSSVVPFSSCLQSFPASGSFPMSQLFTSYGSAGKESACNAGDRVWSLEKGKPTHSSILAWRKPSLNLGIFGFPDSSVGKESACNAGDLSSIPGSGRYPGEGIGYPPQYSWASLVAQLVKNPSVVQDTWSSIPGLGRSPGEGKCYPLQYSGLEIPKTV